jgi:hypothetical protein
MIVMGYIEMGLGIYRLLDRLDLLQINTTITPSRHATK